MRTAEWECPACDTEDAIVLQGNLEDGFDIVSVECGCQLTSAQRGAVEDAVLEFRRERWSAAHAERNA